MENDGHESETQGGRTGEVRCTLHIAYLQLLTEPLPAIDWLDRRKVRALASPNCASPRISPILQDQTQIQIP